MIRPYWPGILAWCCLIGATLTAALVDGLPVWWRVAIATCGLLLVMLALSARPPKDAQ